MKELLNFGYVSNIDENGRVSVIIPELDNYPTDFLPVIRSKSKDDKDGNLLDIDEEVALILNPDGTQGVVLGAISTDKTPLPISDRDKKYYTSKDGSHIEYDRKKHKLSMNVKGSVEFKASKDFVMKAPSISLGESGEAIARKGDSVKVDLLTGIGTIISGGVNTSV